MKTFKPIIFKNQNVNLQLNLCEEDKTIWLTQQQIATLFSKTRYSISNILRTKISDDVKRSHNYVQKTHIIQENSESNFRRPPTYYDLEIIKKIGIILSSDKGELLEAFVNSYFDQNYFDNSKIIIYNNGKVSLDVRVSPEEQTIWLNQGQIALLFETTQPNISMHIKHILEEQELDNSVHKDFLYTAPDGKQYLVDFYNLKMILSLGFRINSPVAIRFRNWASNILDRYLVYGEVRDEERCQICETRLLKVENEVLKIKERQNAEITYFDGNELRGFIEVKRFLECAKREIIIYDNYFDHSFDEVLSKLNVKKTIVTNPKNKKIDTNENYTVIKGNIFHDRYIIVDSSCYDFGQSPGQLGEKYSTGHRISDEIVIDFIKSIKDKILNEGGYNIGLEK